jgi:predicted acylesterase/phospholipase RssA
METAPSAIRIGLCLSGGGYRAAAFHLGVMCYLDRCCLLCNLEALSTVSGGTIVGAKYVLSLIEGRSFPEFYRSVYQFLAGKSLLERCFEILGRHLPDVPSRRSNAVVALAEAYQQALFKRTDGRPLLFQDVIAAPIPIKEVIFNATEFRSGLPFRFRRTTNQSASQGSDAVSLATQDCTQIRIADIVAASSCFPGGFEPLAFPHDFAWTGSLIPENLRDKFSLNDKPSPVALMDGGIGDNQGIDALLEATDSLANIDFLVVSDSDREVDDLYPYPLPPSYGWFGRLTLDTVHRLSHLFAFVCLLTAVAVGAHAVRHWFLGDIFSFWNIFLYVVPLVLAGSAYWALCTIRHILRDEVLAHVPGLGTKSWRFLRPLSLGDFLFMLRLRRSSLSTITSSVFMNRIRELIYRVIDKVPVIADKTLKCRITDLQSEMTVADRERSAPEVLRLIDQAAKMPTTIWFDDDLQLNSLIACGQATLCHRLRQFVKRKYGEKLSCYPEDIQRLWSVVESDWQQFLIAPEIFAQPNCTDNCGTGTKSSSKLVAER